MTSLEDDQIRVNVIPKKLKEGENSALTTPMSFTGTAAALDEQLPDAIASFVASHLELKHSLVRAKEEMDVPRKRRRRKRAARRRATRSLPRNRQGRSTPPRRKNKRRSRNQPGRLVSSITVLSLNRHPSPQGLHL
ncbi:MAG TPA: PRTRC system protein E [Edaphobacter sp.]|nr:PRTRC system protein E [Edaphobacter sp.]